VLSQLTPEQLKEIENDPDGLEFEPSDSVIADIRFAQLLNAEREIQVGDTVYKYFANGVAHTPVDNSDKLYSVIDSVKDIEVTSENEGQNIKLSNNVDFTLVRYEVVKLDEVLSGSVGDTSTAGFKLPDKKGTSNSSGLLLSNGQFIPSTDIRKVDYYSKGDGSWFHYVTTKIFGRNIVAINYFEKDKKLTMNFYDQNYFIYDNIGTKLKLQKKVFGIWWNITAQEMEQGWETVAVKYQEVNPIEKPDIKDEECVTLWSKFPFKNENVLIFRVPLLNYDIKSKDLNNAFWKGVKYALNKASSWALSNVKGDDVGLMLQNGQEHYIVNGPHNCHEFNCRSLESKFYSKWFPYDIILQMSIGATVRFEKLLISEKVKAELYSGKVFGAIKYKDKWLAAIIEKLPPTD
jgi:hypothetical protein